MRDHTPFRAWRIKKQASARDWERTTSEKSESLSQSSVPIDEQHLRKVFQLPLRLQLLLKSSDKLEQGRSLPESEEGRDVGLRELDSVGESVEDLALKGDERSAL